MPSIINIITITDDAFGVCFVVVMGSVMACMSLSCGYDRDYVPWFRQHDQYLQTRADAAWDLAENVSWEAGNQYQDRHGPPVLYVMLDGVRRRSPRDARPGRPNLPQGTKSCLRVDARPGTPES